MLLRRSCCCDGVAAATELRSTSLVALSSLRRATEGSRHSEASASSRALFYIYHEICIPTMHAMRVLRLFDSCTIRFLATATEAQADQNGQWGAWLYMERVADAFCDAPPATREVSVFAAVYIVSSRGVERRSGGHTMIYDIYTHSYQHVRTYQKRGNFF